MKRGCIAGLTLIAALALAACGGKGGASLPAGDSASEAVLRGMLLDELAARGIDADKAPSKAPSGALSPTLLTGIVMDSGEPSPETPQGVSFTVFTMISGDCDFNGVVNISDVTRLAGWMQAVDPAIPLFRNPADADGQPYFPNYSAAYSDGDRNGKLTIADVTPIGVHYGERLDGWHVYVKFPTDSSFKQLEEASSPGQPYFIQRNVYSGGGSGSFTVGQTGTTEFYVVPVDLATGEEGTPSRTFTYVSNEQPSAAFTVSNTEPTTRDHVVLDATSSTDSDGNIADYIWTIKHEGQFPAADSYRIADQYAASPEVQFFKEGSYSISLQVNDDRWAYSWSPEQTVQVTVSGERSPDWQFSEVFDKTLTSGGPTDLQEIAGRAAVINTNLGPIWFSSSPPDGSNWTTPVLALDTPNFIVGPSLAEVGGSPAVAGTTFASISQLTSGAPYKYNRALNSEGSVWGEPVQISTNNFTQGLVGTPSGPYGLLLGVPLAWRWRVWHSDDPFGSGFNIVSDVSLEEGAVEGTQLALRSTGTQHYVIGYDGVNSEIMHSSDMLSWNKVASIANPDQHSNSRPFIVDGRLALAWAWENEIFYTMALDERATQWIPRKLVTSGIAKPANGGIARFAIGVTFLDGTPAIAYADSDYVLKLIRATNSNGTQWDQAGQETISSYGILRDCDLEVIGGQPALTVYNHSTGKIEYARKL